MSTRQIFLSHSSADGALATLLANEIEQELGKCVFNASDDNAIDIGDTWFDKVIDELDKSDFLIILLTNSSKDSRWVAFEFGYFWHKVDPLQRNKRIYILHHQIEDIPSPFSTLQSKKINVYRGLENFFNQLCQNFAGRDFTDKADLDAIIREANKMQLPIKSKSLQDFAYHLERSEWVIKRNDNNDITRARFTDPSRNFTVWGCTAYTDYEIWIESLGKYRAVGDESMIIHYKSRKGHDPKVIQISKVFLKNAGNDIYQPLIFFHYPDKESLVPQPDLKKGSEDEHIWSKSSLIMKVARVISHVGEAKAQTMDELMNILRDPANHLWIEIVD